MSESNQQVTALVNSEELRAYVDSRINAQQTDPEELAREVAAILEVPDTGSLSDGQAEQVATMIEERVSVGFTPEQRAAIEEIVQTAIDESGGGGGGGSTTDPERGAAIDRKLNTLELLSQPTHRTVIDTGTPTEDMHPYGDWGQIITVHEDVCWQSALIDAETQGVTRFLIEEIDYEAGETYDLGDVHATFEVDHSAGLDEIHPRVVLPKGTYFISRDPNQVVPMRRVMTDVDWDAFNQENAAPVSFECSWRARADYQPGEAGYQKYRENNWHRRLFYFANMKFGHMAEPEQRGG